MSLINQPIRSEKNNLANQRPKIEKNKFRPIRGQYDYHVMMSRDAKNWKKPKNINLTNFDRNWTFQPRNWLILIFKTIKKEQQVIFWLSWEWFLTKISPPRILFWSKIFSPGSFLRFLSIWTFCVVPAVVRGVQNTNKNPFSLSFSD